MKPIDQKLFSSDEEPGRGDCLTAAVASLLELPYESVPYWSGMPQNEWGLNFVDFLRKSGYEYVGTKSKLPDDSNEVYWEKVANVCKGVNGYYVVAGTSARGWARGHAVVYKDGKLAHDPHPSRVGVEKIWYCYLIERKEIWESILSGETSGIYTPYEDNNRD